MSRSEPWGAIAVPMEAHSKQRGQPLRMRESGELKYGQMGQRVRRYTDLAEPNTKAAGSSWFTIEFFRRIERLTT